MKISLAGVVSTLLMAGWVASACIRSWQGVEVHIVEEMLGAGTATAIVYAQMSGGAKPSEDQEGGASS